MAASEPFMSVAPIPNRRSSRTSGFQGLPFTHAIEAARQVAAGASLGDVRGLLGAELLVGVIYGVAGYALLRWMEVQSRRSGSLERS
jgi:hypothetical protein